MTEKLKVSRYVADAIESLNRDSFTVSTNIQRHADSGWKSAERAPLNTLSLEELATALIVGYEVEMTPHEEIAQLYKYHYPKAEKIGNLSEISFSRGYVEGVKFTLEKLDIKIKGVNDK